MTRPTFSLFQSHLDLAHSYWKAHLKPLCHVIDATCGNGHDSLFLANHLNGGSLYCIDIQKTAIDSTKSLLEKNLPTSQLDSIYFFNQSHETFPSEIPCCDLIIYNLGYLPGGDKNQTTDTSSTIKSFKNALQLLKPQGLISITCYPGHAEGALEQEALLNTVRLLSPQDYLVCHHIFENRKAAPSLLLVFKKT